MFQRTFLTGLAVTLLVVQACGSDDNKRNVVSNDAGMGGEAGADEPASGGSSAGEAPVPMGGEPGQPTAGAGGADEPSAGSGGQPPLEPQPEVLFTVRDDAVGLPNTAVADEVQPQNVIYTSSTGVQDTTDGTNTVKVVGADLGLADSDSIVSFTLLQTEPEYPMYLFTVADGSEGGVPTRVFESYWDDGQEEGDIYFSDAVTSYRYLGEGGDEHGYNGLLASETSLGLSPGVDEAFPDELRGLLAHDANEPITELYFTTDTNAVGLTDSAVEATPADQRGCTLFKSALDGTNSVVFSCSDLGLVAGDQIDALLLYGDATPSELLFSVTRLAQGAVGTAVEAAVLNGPDPAATLFRSTGDGTNTVSMAPTELGMGYQGNEEDDIDGIAVINAPPASVSHAATCTITYEPFDLAQGGGLTTSGGSRYIGANVLVLFGATAASPRLIAYNATTCAFIQQKDMPVGFNNAHGWAIAPLAGWSAAAPLDNVEFFRAEYNGTGTDMHRHDDTGTPVAPIPISNVFNSVAGLVYEPVGDQLYLLTNDYFAGYQLGLWVMPRPAAAVAQLDPVLHRLPLPCTYNVSVTGTDALGNLYLAQAQGTGADYRVCAYTPQGELMPSPYWWTPQVTLEQTGFIVGGASHYLLNTSLDAGPFVIERGVYQPP